MDWLDFREPFNAWTHGVWLLLSLPATLLLWRLIRGNRIKRFSLLVFGLSLTFCFAGSTLYHGVRLPPEELKWFANLDYIGIYVLIAGTCVLFLCYLPLFARVPRLLSVPLRDGDPFWVLPMLMMGGCLAGLCCWLWQGLSTLGRSIWAAVFALAVLGYPFAFVAALFTGPG